MRKIIAISLELKEGRFFYLCQEFFRQLSSKPEVVNIVYHTMNKEFIQPMPVGSLTQSQDLGRLSAARAQEQFNTTVFMARQNNGRATLTVDEKGRAQYNTVPEKTNGTNLSSGEHIILEVPTVLPLSTTSTNEQKKPSKPRQVNVAVEDKNRRREQNEAIFYGIRGKTVYQRGQPVNIKNGAVNSENGTRNKTKSRGRRNGSR